MITFKGKLIAVLPERSGLSMKTGNDWRSQDFVIQEEEGQYPDTIVATAMNEKIDYIIKDGIVIGDSVEASIDLRAKQSEGGGRWFNSLNIFKMVKAGAQTAPAQPEQQAPAQGGKYAGLASDIPAGYQPINKPKETGNTDDLPF